jgi:hypothetical protein
MMLAKEAKILNVSISLLDTLKIDQYLHEFYMDSPQCWNRTGET